VQGRLSEVEPSKLVKLHGLLIAFGWVDQNMGNTPVGRPGTVVSGYYRVTEGGLRVIKVTQTEQGEPDAVEAMASNPAESSEPKRRVWRKGKSGRLKKAAADHVDVPEATAGEQVPCLAWGEECAERAMPVTATRS
jgi:hypothetical protein